MSEEAGLVALVSLNRTGDDEHYRGTIMDLGKYPSSAAAFAAGQPFVLCR